MILKEYLENHRKKQRTKQTHEQDSIHHKKNVKFSPTKKFKFLPSHNVRSDVKGLFDWSEIEIIRHYGFSHKPVHGKAMMTRR